jgi:methylphosphotriester-DNA--protein-cysteine methyltransferase
MLAHNNINCLGLHKQIRNQTICFAGNKKLKIYGALFCRSGKRMKKENRIFFNSEKEAIANGYRPCGICMNQKYQNWKNQGEGKQLHR